MAVINLGPSRWSKMGMRLGQGMSQGLEQAIEQARQKRLRRERVQRQYQDLQGLSEALRAAQERKQGQAQNVLQTAQQKQSGGPPQARDYNEIEKPGMSSREFAFNQYEPQTQFGVKLAQQKFGQQKRGGLSRGDPFVNDQGQRVVPLYDKQTGQLVRTQKLGKTQQSEDQWSEPYQKGNQLLQKNLKTGKVRKAYQTGDQDPSQREKKIQQYMDLYGWDRETATKYADNLIQVRKGPLGYESPLDITTFSSQTAEQSQQTGQGQPGEEGTAEPFISAEETQKGVGPISSVKQMMNNIVGPFTPGQLFGDTEQARNKLRMFRQKVKPALMVSSRGAIWEQQQINEMLPDPDQFFTDPDAVVDKLRNLYGMVRSEIDRKQQLMEGGGISADQVQQYQTDINNMKTVLSYMPNPEVLFSEEAKKSGRTQDVTVQSINSMSLGDLQSLNIDSLNQAQTRAALNRIEQLEQGGQ